ncbi:hypothetical protein Peur_034489 [Populus x canadensis]
MLGEKDTTKTDSDMYDRSINQQDFCMERERDRLLCKLSRNPTRDPAEGFRCGDELKGEAVWELCKKQTVALRVTHESKCSKNLFVQEPKHVRLRWKRASRDKEDKVLNLQEMYIDRDSPLTPNRVSEILLICANTLAVGLW